MSFGSPYFLFALLAVPGALVGYALLERRRARRSAAWSRPALLPNIVQHPSGWARHLPIALFLLGLSALLVGFARPQRVVVDAHPKVPTVVVVIDVSGSMAAADIAPSRVGAARALATAFLRELPARYLASVVTFGSKVSVVAAPTLDHGEAVAQLPKTITPKAGTSLGDAITSAVAVVTSTSGASVYRSKYPGVVLVFSDGAQTAGGTTPIDAGDAALAEGVPVDTVAVGTRAGTVTQPLSVDGFDTSVQYGVPVDPATLSSVATLAYGHSYALGSASQIPALTVQLRAVYGKLAAPSQPVTRVQELSAIFAAAALVLIVAAIGTSVFWFGRAA